VQESRVLHERKQKARSDIKEEVGGVKIVWMLKKRRGRWHALVREKHSKTAHRQELWKV